jgi:hypothetical protein
MKFRNLVTHNGFALLVSLFLATGILMGQAAAPSPEQKDDAAGFKEFMGRVDQYVKLRDPIEKKLPALKSKEELPEMIAAHQQALARKIREARPHAKPGDIFTPAAREAFKHMIRSEFKDPQHTTARNVVKQRDPLKGVRLRVNGLYPNAVAETTFPATLLQKLPTLPDELGYRIVGRDLVLVDKKANLVVDLLHEACP